MLLITKLDGKNVAKGFLQPKVGGGDVYKRAKAKFSQKSPLNQFIET